MSVPPAHGKSIIIPLTAMTLHKKFPNYRICIVLPNEYLHEIAVNQYRCTSNSVIAPAMTDDTYYIIYTTWQEMKDR